MSGTSPRGVSRQTRNDVLALLGGTAVAQAIMFAFLPLLTRLYRPEDFGVMSVFLGITSVTSIIATGSYELALMLPRREKEVTYVALLCTGLAAAVSVVVIPPVAVLRRFVVPGLFPGAGWLWTVLLPFAVFTSALIEITQYHLIRKKMFGAISGRKIVQYGVMTLIQAAAGFAAAGAPGLVAGLVLGQFAGIVMPLLRFVRENRSALLRARLADLAVLMRRYREFPSVMVPARLVNVGALQLPNILLAHAFGTRLVGLFNLPQRMLDAPVSLLAGSVHDVFMDRASEEYRRTGQCRTSYLRTLRGLLVMSVFPFVAFYVCAPFLVPFVFGTEWAAAGEIARTLSVLYFARFVAIPLSNVFFIADGQKINLYWQTALLAASAGSVFLGISRHDARLSITALSFSCTCLYALNVLLSFHLSGGRQAATALVMAETYEKQ